jgi:predicted MPP superfamily phosphohydrolase
MGNDISALILSDTHFKFVDRRAYDLACYVGASKKVDLLIINGDFVDFHAISGWGKAPGIREEFYEEIEAILIELQLLSKMFCNAKKVFIVGNHCVRLNSFIQKKAPQFYSLVTLDKLLHLTELGFEIIDYDPYQAYMITPDIGVRHEPPPGPITSMLGKAKISLLTAHCHRGYEWHEIGLNKKQYDLYGLYWLGDKDSLAMKYPKYAPNWQLGFMYLRINNNLPTYFNTIINPGSKYTCELDGKIYTN